MLTRRRLLSASAASLLAPLARPAQAGEEPFPIFASDTNAVPYRYRKQQVAFDGEEAAGTIVINTGKRFLYLVQDGGKALRYGVGVGAQGFAWAGEAVIKRKAKWPRWTPTQEQLQRHKSWEKWAKGMEGGSDNPLGARALYLYQGNQDTHFRIHGTTVPKSIGKAVSSGCIRMINADIVDLYDRVELGTRVVVLKGSLGGIPMGLRDD